MSYEVATEEKTHDEPIHIAKDVWRVAWPAMSMNVLQTVNAFIDRIFVGTLGTVALAAVGVAGTFLFLFISIAFSMATGTTAIVARAWGAKNVDEAVKATRQSVSLSVVLGLFFTFVCYFVAKPYVKLLGLEPSAEEAVLMVLKWTSLGIFPLFIFNAISGSFRGMGDTLRPMYVMIIVNAAHITTAYLLIFGNFGFPKLGLTGDAIAIALCQYVGLVVFIIVFYYKGLRGGLKFELPELSWWLRLLRIGVPAALQAFLRISSMMMYMFILARIPHGTAALSALQVGLIAEGVAYMPGFAYSVAASALVGQNLGRKDPDRAERIGWMANWQGCITMTVLGVVFFILAPQIAHWFISNKADPEYQIAIDMTVSYLRIVAFSEPFLAFGMILTGALQGAGDTVRPAWATLVSFWIIRLPMTALFALVFKWGASGAWLAMSISTIISGLIILFIFKSGKWKTMTV